MTKLVNLTPHRLNLHDEDENEILSVEPSGDVARVETERVKVGTVQGVPLYETHTGEVQNLPEPEDGVLYVVSGFVRSATDRNDVVSPGELIRDEDGNPVGAQGLTR
jgi:hypothetical protein